MNKRTHRRRRGGFTLMEILLVLAILVVLGSLVTVGYVQVQKNAYMNAARTQIKMFDDAVEVANIANAYLRLGHRYVLENLLQVHHLWKLQVRFYRTIDLELDEAVDQLEEYSERVRRARDDYSLLLDTVGQKVDVTESLQPYLAKRFKRDSPSRQRKGKRK